MAKGFIGDSGYKAYLGALKMRKGYIGATKVYSSGTIVTYNVDMGVSYQEEVDEGASCLLTKTFIPEKSGWEFTGWRQDTDANESMLSSLVMGDAPITLYAVFRQTITLSYNGNSATSGSTEAQTGYRYYNNGNVANPIFTLSANGFSRSGATFVYWAANGTTYNAGSTVTLSESTVFYAKWQLPDETISMSRVFTQSDYSSVVHCLDAGYGSVSNKVLYNIDGSKYRGFSLSVYQTTMTCNNNTGGIRYTNFYINGKLIRAAITRNDGESGSTGNESNYAGALSYGGKSFTLIVENASSIYWSGSYGCLSMFHGSIKLLGAIV